MTDIKNFQSLANELLPRFTGDPVSDIRAIYEYLDACDPGTRTLLLSSPGSSASKDFFHTLFTSENCAFSFDLHLKLTQDLRVKLTHPGDLALMPVTGFTSGNLR